MDREAGDLITGDTRDLIVLSSSPTYPVEVVITVTDINDNSPQFPNPVSQISFSEGSTPGTRALLDSAIDIDTGSNGRIVEYRIQSGNEEAKSYVHMMNETTPTDSFVTQVSTRDADTGENSRLASSSVLISCVSTPPRPGSDRASAFNWPGRAPG